MHVSDGLYWLQSAVARQKCIHRHSQHRSHIVTSRSKVTTTYQLNRLKPAVSSVVADQIRASRNFECRAVIMFKSVTSVDHCPNRTGQSVVDMAIRYVRYCKRLRDRKNVNSHMSSILRCTALLIYIILQPSRTSCQLQVSHTFMCCDTPHAVANDVVTKSIVEVI